MRATSAGRGILRMLESIMGKAFQEMPADGSPEGRRQFGAPAADL
jgi:hypothetical protein